MILIGILDEGAKIKFLTEHDKTFQLPRFIWSKTAPQASCNADEQMQKWLLDQGKTDVINCVDFGSVTSSFSDRKFYKPNLLYLS